MSSSVLGPGEVVAERYRIEGLLGQGGMGSVYRALQLSVGRSVALKLLAPEQLASREHVERFEREAQALARLQHPSTVRLFDFGSAAPGRPFIVMELLGGADLQAELAHNGPMRWRQALQVCEQILGSLGEAHELGIIHRDIKPANVFLCSGAGWPSVKVLDFGIAGCIELATTRKLTATGTVLGSAPYMSPEQAQGQAVGPAADMYALGVVLFEMLAGRTPFEGRGFTAQLLAKVLEPAPGLLEAAPALEVPAGVCELVAALLERDAERRPASARALRGRMAELLQRGSEAPLARPLPPPVSALSLPRTEPMLVPRTIADGGAPGSVTPVAVAGPRVGPRRANRRRLLASGFVLTALAVGWGARAPSEPAGHARAEAPGPLVALAMPGPVEPGVGGPAGLDAGASELGAGDASAAPATSKGGGDGADDDGGGREVAADAGGGGTESASEAGAASAPGAGAAAAGRAPAAKPAAAPGPRAPGPGPRRPARPRSASASASTEQGTGAVAAGSTGAPAPSSAAPSLRAGAAPGPVAASPTPEHIVFPGAGAAAGTPPAAPEPAAAPGAAAAASPGAEAPPVPPAAAPLPSWPERARSPSPPPERARRSERELLRRYPSVAAVREAERGGELTPEERNTVVAALRRERRRERARVVREYRAGYIDRGELRARLREIELRFEGWLSYEPPAGIHIWP